MQFRILFWRNIFGTISSISSLFRILIRKALCEFVRFLTRLRILLRFWRSKKELYHLTPIFLFLFCPGPGPREVVHELESVPPDHLRFAGG
jgi:hypothetical protein